MFKKLSDRIGLKTGTIDDLLIYKEVCMKSIQSIEIYRGVKHYHEKFSGRYWSKSKTFAATYAGTEGYLLSATVPSLIDKTAWIIDSINYCFPDIVVDRFKITASKISDSKFI